MDVIILFIIEYNYTRLIQHEMLKKPVTFIIIRSSIPIHTIHIVGLDILESVFPARL